MIIILEQMMLVTYAFEESAPLPRPNRCVLLAFDPFPSGGCAKPRLLLPSQARAPPSPTLDASMTILKGA